MHWGSIFLGNSSYARALHQLDPCDPAGQAAVVGLPETSQNLENMEHMELQSKCFLAFNPRSTTETAVKTLLTLFQR